MPKVFGRRKSAAQRDGGKGKKARGSEAPAEDSGSRKATSSRELTVVPAAVDTGAQADFTQVGEQVAFVLAAAKEAAETLRSEAIADAQRARETGEKDARAALEQASTAKERADAEAAKALADAELESASVRERADEYATDTREAADAKAAAVVARAEKQAAAHVRMFEERRQALDDGVVRTEERLRKLVAGLHELAAGLEELVAPAERGSNGDTELMLANLSRSVGEVRLPPREDEAN